MPCKPFYTIIRFQQRTNELDYVIIDPVNHPMSCHSAVGKKGGPQKVRCGNCKIDGAFHYGRILHELFHVVGRENFLMKISLNSCDITLL